MMSSGSLKQSLIIGIGSGLEFYDFILFGMLAAVLAQVFFPVDSSSLAMMKTYALFGLTYFIRPIGGVLFAHWGDTRGRKRVFNHTISLMAVATLLIALLPGYVVLGNWAPLLLLMLRMIQALAQGAELPGAITLICEYDKANQSINTGILFSLIGLGAGLATLMAYLLNHCFTQQQIIAYAWRLPFFLGAGVGFIAAYLRRHGIESPQFNQNSISRIPVLTLLKKNPAQVLKGIALVLFTAVLIVIKVSFPQLFHFAYGIKPQAVYLALSVSFVFVSVYQLAIGFFVSARATKRVYVLTSCTAGLTLTGLFYIIGHHGFYGLVIGLCLYQVLIASLVVCYIPLLANCFDVQVRYTGVALSYNLSFSIAALSPLFVNYAIANAISLSLLYWLIAALAFVGILAVSIPKRGVRVLPT